MIPALRRFSRAASARSGNARPSRPDRRAAKESRPGNPVQTRPPARGPPAQVPAPQPSGRSAKAEWSPENARLEEGNLRMRRRRDLAERSRLAARRGRRRVHDGQSLPAPGSSEGIVNVRSRRHLIFHFPITFVICHCPNRADSKTNDKSQNDLYLLHLRLIQFGPQTFRFFDTLLEARVLLGTQRPELLEIALGFGVAPLEQSGHAAIGVSQGVARSNSMARL